MARCHGDRDVSKSTVLGIIEFFEMFHCYAPQRLRFWSLDFGFGLRDSVWMLHKVSPCPADSGWRVSIYILTVARRCTQSLMKEVQILLWFTVWIPV